MKNLFMIRFVLLALLVLVVLGLPNQRPIIGIYTQSDEDDEPRVTSSAAFQTYIAASYVKFVEMSGAQVVPILAYSSQSQIASLLPKLNGVLFPGGGVEFDIKNRWTSNANYIFQYAIRQNDAGNVFPIWGTCLGHQLLSFLTNNFSSPLSAVRGETAVMNTIKFASADKGTLFSDMSQKLTTKITSGQGIAYFNHHWAISRSTFDANKNLNSFWKLIGQTTSSYNEKFVSVWQAKKYPFYGVQFHPQKAIFEWKVYSDKSYESIEMTQIICNRFIQKARQSKNQFSGQDDFMKVSIYNHNMYPTSMSFTRIYLFNETRPAYEQNTYEKSNTMFKIDNPQSVKYEHNWGNKDQQRLMRQA